MTRTDRYRSSGTASVLRCQRTPFRSTIAVLHCPRFRSTGRGKYREGKRRGAGMGAERGTHATGVTTGATGVGGLAGQLTAGARRTSQVTYSAMGSPLATSGRFCRRIQPERPRSGSVSPGQRSRQRTTPAENRTETKDPWQNQGPFPAEPPRSRMATVNANRGGGGVFRKRLASRKVASRTHLRPLFTRSTPSQCRAPPFSLRILSSAFASWRAAAAG